MSKRCFPKRLRVLTYTGFFSLGVETCGPAERKARFAPRTWSFDQEQPTVISRVRYATDIAPAPDPRLDSEERMIRHIPIHNGEARSAFGAMIDCHG